MILVISLDRSHARRQAVTAAMDALGLAFRFVDAVDARRDALTPVAPAARIRAAMERDMSDGEKACALSHRKAYETFLAGEDSHAVILEDDAIPSPAFAAFLGAGGHLRHPMILYYHSGARVLRKPGVPALGDHRLFRLALPANGAVAYSLDRASAKALLAAQTPVVRKADWPMDIATLGALVVVPQLVGHPDRIADPGQSLLAAGRTNRRGLRLGRYLRAEYYRRKLLKLTTRRVS
ncbi:hypothetical protein BV509_18655 [Rhodovulum sulfidophilum]|uniref:Glycosyltransferase family 25 protein n=1 Tax=Rhodovulum visakhapatnamense TaxID=364297 RepID=A0ABS1RDI3_9RHOB|nr:glycosyltransferase family 25 protein [Rhodovulum visakhapatnamense]MBL3569040.1 glycosyltransferase family 25 protein [Rhodovulum visakhapatnamense]MBL3577002.1 glycosyltransferase family 25 protein [Rhodovulum visakhapatnamense]OLS46169.1 hypothetical protein BV509_18655 [Rhodovulum sulfidophilum]